MESINGGLEESPDHRPGFGTSLGVIGQEYLSSLTDHKAGSATPPGGKEHPFLMKRRGPARIVTQECLHQDVEVWGVPEWGAAW